MTFDINLVDTEIDASKYVPITYDKLPKLFLGFILKNRFDEENITPTDNDNIVDIAHICGRDGSLEPVFLRGMFVDPIDKFKKIITEVHKNRYIDTNIIYKKYIKTLSKHNLTCNNTYAYLLDGLFPIDIIHIASIIKNCLTYEEYISCILEEDTLSWFFQPELKCCILSKCNAYIFKNS